MSFAARLRAEHILHAFALFLRRNVKIAQITGLPEPDRGLVQVFFHAVSQVIAFADHVDGKRVPQLRRPTEVFQGLPVILLYPVSLKIQVGKIVQAI